MQPLFITEISSSGRYFLDQYGQPVLIKGWSPWSAFIDLSPSQMDTLCQGAQDAGVNAFIVSLIGAIDNGGPSNNGATYDGVLPFVSGNITNWNETYWARIDSYLGKMRDHGITAFLYVIDGWNIAHLFNGKSNANCQTYGTMVANRFASLPNIVWMTGGDYFPITNEPWDGSVIDHQFDAMLTGIRSTGDTRPFSIQMGYQRSFSADNQFWEARADFSFCYTYEPTYECVWDSYDRVANSNEQPGERDPRPSLFMEGAYEDENYFGPDTTNETLRRQFAWAVTAGSPGDFYGSDDWDFHASDWATRLNTTAIQQRKKLRSWFENLAGWYLLVPDEGRTDLVTAGRGTKVSNLAMNAQIDPLENDYVTAAQTPDKSLALIYVPTNNANTNTRTITLNPAMFPAGYTATWVDPTNAISTQPATVNGSNQVTTPALHGDGTRDWLLLIQAPTTPGSSAGKIWLNGVAYPVLTHNGTTWVEREVYFHDGSSWTLSK